MQQDNNNSNGEFIEITLNELDVINRIIKKSKAISAKQKNQRSLNIEQMVFIKK